MPESAGPTIPRAAALRIVVGLAILAGAILATLSIVRAGELRYDFHHFYYDARYLLENGRLNTADHLRPDDGGPHLPWYLPFTTMAFVPIAALGPWVGGIVWTAVNLAALVLTIWLVGTRLAHLPARDWPLTQALPVALCAAAIYEHARFNQLAVVVLALVVAAFVLLQRGRDLPAGLLLGVASLLKLLPVVLLPWLLLKRRFKAAGAVVAAAVVLDVVPCLVWFGPAATLAYHRRWVGNSVIAGSGVRMLLHLEDPMYARMYPTFLDYRNQSLAMVIGRATGVVPGLWPTSGPSPPAPRFPLMLFAAANALVAACLLWLWRRPWRALTAEQQAAELALGLLAMLWFSPLMRQYYLVWTYPAVAIVLARADAHRLAGRTAWLCWAALTGSVLATGAWALDAWLFDHAARSFGVNLWSVLLLGVALAVELGRPIRSPAPRPTTLTAAA